MATNKKSVLLYCDLIYTVEKLSNEDAGELFKHYLRYINDLDPITDNALVDVLFESIKQNLKRDLKKWETRAERSKENGKLGGRPKKPKKPSGLKNNLTEPRKPDTVTVTDTVKVTVNDIKEIVNYLNGALGSNYKHSTETTKVSIQARFNQGFTVEDFKQVIDVKVKDWGSRRDMVQYLRPQTLFGTKFESYLNQKEATESREDELKIHLLKHLEDVRTDKHVDVPTDGDRVRRIS